MFYTVSDLQNQLQLTNIHKHRQISSSGNRPKPILFTSNPVNTLHETLKQQTGTKKKVIWQINGASPSQALASYFPKSFPFSFHTPHYLLPYLNQPGHTPLACPCLPRGLQQ